LILIKLYYRYLKKAYSEFDSDSLEKAYSEFDIDSIEKAYSEFNSDSLENVYSAFMYFKNIRLILL
jgi:hypothetical protein